MADQTQEQLLAEQKANCIFCKIVSGEQPSKLVYEDEAMLAILDIRPAVKGHCLILPREHYPIMPLIPPAEFDHLFGRTAALTGALRKAMLAKRCTVFIANGAIAGQQSPHFLFHLIPRDDGDGLGNFDIPKKAVNQDDIAGMLQENLAAVMRQHLVRAEKSQLLAPEKTTFSQASAPQTQTPPVSESTALHPASQQAQKQSPIAIDQLAAIIEDNPDLKALLINNPEKLEGILQQNPQIQQLFDGVDVKKLGEALREKFINRQSPVQPPEKVFAKEGDIKGSDTKEGDIIPAMRLPLQEIFVFIDQKPKLRKLILKDPDQLKAMIPDNERLSIFFAGSNVDAIIQAYRAYAKANQGEEVAQ